MQNMSQEQLHEVVEGLLTEYSHIAVLLAYEAHGGIATIMVQMQKDSLGTKPMKAEAKGIEGIPAPFLRAFYGDPEMN